MEVILFESEKVKKNKVEILSYNSSSEICYFYKIAMLDVCVFVTNFLFLHKEFILKFACSLNY